MDLKASSILRGILRWGVREYLHWCTSKASKESKASKIGGGVLRECLHWCTSESSKANKANKESKI
jgi:hypothetical protein